MLGTFVLAFVEASRVSPYAGLRPLAIAIAIGFALTIAATALLRDRHRGAFFALIAAVLVVAGGQPWMGLVLLVVLIVLIAEAVAARRRDTIRWPLVTRSMWALTSILLLAVVVRGLQHGRVIPLLRELIAEAPGNVSGLVHSVDPGEPRTPDVYLVLLDGYPRADKLMSEFGIDNAPFLDALRTRGFDVAEHSRSNYPATRMTLASMFNGTHLENLPTTPDGRFDWRRAIDEGAQLEAFRSAGYRVVSISSGYEDAVLRRADTFIDTGQANELERALLSLSLVRAVAPDSLANFLARSHGERIEQSFDAAMEVAAQGGPPRLAFVHIGSPHAPLVLRADGSALGYPRAAYPFDDHQEAASLGDFYDRLLLGQIEYLNRRTLELLEAITSSERPAVVVVFSDHGSGVAYSDLNPQPSSLDLRTANLLALSVPTGSSLIDQRSTLINLLPRIAHMVLQVQLHEAPEDIRIYPGERPPPVSYERPD
jgi:hypothetical protein